MAENEYIAALKAAIRHLKQQIPKASKMDQARLKHQLKVTQTELMQETRQSKKPHKQSKQDAIDSASDIYR
jgi:hypothetical protein